MFLQLNSEVLGRDGPVRGLSGLRSRSDVAADSRRYLYLSAHGALIFNCGSAFGLSITEVL